jgi:TIR domain
MPHDVFISYATTDKPIADAVCAAVEARGFRCWIAPRDVTPGMPYGEAIIKAIQGCRLMILVFSSNANSSPHIPKEVERAVTKHTPIIPFRIEHVAAADSLDYFIGSLHWLDALTPPLEPHLQTLADAIAKTLPNEAVAATSDPLPARHSERPGPTLTPRPGSVGASGQGAKNLSYSRPWWRAPQRSPWPLPRD